MPSTNYVIEPGNFTRYDLIYCEYLDHKYSETMCSVTWLTKESGGSTLTFRKGANLWANHVLEKSGINKPDLAPILCDVKKRFPGSIGELQGFDEYDENGLYRG